MRNVWAFRILEQKNLKIQKKKASKNRKLCVLKVLTFQSSIHNSMRTMIFAERTLECTMKRIAAKRGFRETIDGRCRLSVCPSNAEGTAYD